MTSKYEHLNLKLGRQAQDLELDPIPREIGRSQMNIDRPFFGYDLWNAWEVGFLLPNGLPVRRAAQIAYSCHSKYIVESKSLKLFLNHLLDEVFVSEDAFFEKIRKEIENCVQDKVEIRSFAANDSHKVLLLEGDCLEELFQEVVSTPTPRAADMTWRSEEGECICHSHSFRSNCPITFQPDFGSIQIALKGTKLPDAQHLFSYLMAFRKVNEFHESCCEKIFETLLLGQPEDLDLTLFFTRRGGLDINPRRSTHEVEISWGYRVWPQ